MRTEAAGAWCRSGARCGRGTGSATRTRAGCRPTAERPAACARPPRRRGCAGAHDAQLASLAMDSTKCSASHRQKFLCRQAPIKKLLCITCCAISCPVPTQSGLTRQEGGGLLRTRWQGRLGSMLGLRGRGSDREGGGGGWDAMWRQQQADHRGAERLGGSSGVSA